MSILRRARWIVVLGVAAAAGAGVSYAAIPAGNGVINGCFNKNSGALRVTDPQTNQPAGCSTKETALAWNQQGLPGPKGDPGPSEGWVSGAYAKMVPTGGGNVGFGAAAGLPTGKYVLSGMVRWNA